MVPDRAFHRLRGRRIWRAGPVDRRQEGHAVTVVGYSERGRYFKVVNSWGRRWGERGFGRIGYDTFRRRVKYGFAMRLAAKPAPPKPKPPPAVQSIGCRRFPAAVSGSRRKRQAGRHRLRRHEGRSGQGAPGLGKGQGKDGGRAAALAAMRDPDDPGEIAGPHEPAGHRPAEARLPGRRDPELRSPDGRLPGLSARRLCPGRRHGGQPGPFRSGHPPDLRVQVRLIFGDGREGRAKFTVSAPFGREMIVAVASRSPLFAGKRPQVETEREFLTALRRAIVARPDPTQPKRVVGAAFVALETKQGE